MKYEEAKEIADSIKMPELKGSEKQVAWANKIRAEKLNVNYVESWIVQIRINAEKQGCSPEETQQKEQRWIGLVEQFLANHASAGWWIEHKATSIKEAIIRGL